MKKCPYCAEEIQDEAIVCRYCGGDLKKKGSIWVIAIPVGLVLAALIFLATASRPLANPNDLKMHFVTNVLIWSLIMAVLTSLDRWLKTKGFGFFWGIIILSVVLFFLFSSTGANILGQSSQIKNFLESGITNEAIPKAKRPAVVASVTPKQTPSISAIPSGVLYVFSSTSTTDGAAGGRLGIQQICPNEDPEAHFCSVSEIENAWTTTGIFFSDPFPMSWVDNKFWGNSGTDCSKWSSTGPSSGAAIYNSAVNVSSPSCQTTLSVACCKRIP